MMQSAPSDINGRYGCGFNYVTMWEQKGEPSCLCCTNLKWHGQQWKPESAFMLCMRAYVWMWLPTVVCCSQLPAVAEQTTWTLAGAAAQPPTRRGIEAALRVRRTARLQFVSRSEKTTTKNPSVFKSLVHRSPVAAAKTAGKKEERIQ